MTRQNDVEDPKKDIPSIEMDQSVKPGESHRKGVRQIFKILLEQWFLISLGIVIAIAFQAQVPKAHQHTKQMVVMYLCQRHLFHHRVYAGYESAFAQLLKMGNSHIRSDSVLTRNLCGRLCYDLRHSNKQRLFRTGASYWLHFLQLCSDNDQQQCGNDATS